MSKRTKGRAHRARAGRAQAPSRRPARARSGPRAAGHATAGGRLLAKDLMTRDPITVPEEMTIGELCDLLQEKNINGAPVVDRKGLLVGIVAQDDIIYGAMGHSDGDLPAAAGAPTGSGPAAEPGSGGTRRRSQQVVRLLRERRLAALPDARPRSGEKPFWADSRPAGDPLRMPVSAIMTSPAISAEETTPIKDLCHIMWNLRIHRVPIVRGGRVTGLVSSMDLCRAVLSGLIRI